MPLTKVSAGVIAANAVNDSFGTQSITGDKLGLTAINANNIVGGAVTGDKLGATSINANNIVNATITGAKLAANTVSGDVIGQNAISSNNIAAGAVTNISSGTSNVSVTSTNGNVTIGTAGVERGRVDNAGNFLVGVTSTLLASGSCFVNDTLAGDSPQLILRNAQNTAGRYWKIGAVGGAGGVNPYMIVYSATDAGVYMSYGGTSWSSTSDESKKENLVPITDAVTKISSLRTVIGNFIDDEEKTKHPFLIAQDVQKVLPEAIDEKDGVLGLKYSDMIPLLTAAIKEQQAIITDLKARIEVLEAQ